MKSFYKNTKNSLKYGLKDKKVILILGLMYFLSSFVNKFDVHPNILKLVNLFLLFIIGYGSYITWTTVNNIDELPDIKKYREIIWEGFKKSLILLIYTLIITYLIHCFLYYHIINPVLSAISLILALLTYLILIVGLINRTINYGNILKSFDLKEIVELMIKFDKKILIKVIIAALMGQIISIISYIDIHPGFTLTEAFITVLSLILTPILYITTKRLIGIHIGQLLEKNSK